MSPAPVEVVKSSKSAVPKEMPWYKKLLGIALLLFSFSFIILIGMPQIFLQDSAGRVEKEIDLDLEFLKDEKAKLVLLYFGYVGCETICTPSMNEVSEIYQSIQNENLQVYFVNLQSKIQKDMPEIFAKHFNKQFHGIYLNETELNKLKNKIRINYTKSPTDTYDINHAGHLYFLLKNKEGYTQKYIYTTRPFNKALIIKDIQHFLN